MKRIRILLAAMLASAVCLGAVPATSTAATPSLTITCTRAPGTCTAVGQLGSLTVVTVVTKGLGVVDICLDAQCTYGALLVVKPGLLFGYAVAGPVAGLVVLTGHLLVAGAEVGGIGLGIAGTGGVIAGTLVLIPGHPQCLVIDHLKLTSVFC